MAGIIVIGASAGGVSALETLVGGLPEDLPATVFVAMHLAPGKASVLPSILTRAGGSPRSTRRTARSSNRGRSTSLRPTITCCCATGCCA